MITLKEWAKNNNINHNTARVWAWNNRLIGAVKIGRDWHVPDDAKRPVDRRYVDKPIRNRRENNS